MSPIISIYNVVNCAFGNVKFSGNKSRHRSIFPKTPYFFYRIFSQFNIARFFSNKNSSPFFGKFFPFCVSIFFHHVKKVVFYCSQKQVVWINAIRIVAMMTNKQIVFNNSIFNCPRNPARPKVSCMGFVPHDAVSLAVNATNPLPTDANVLLSMRPYSVFIYFFPESVFKFFGDLYGMSFHFKPPYQTTK